MKIPELGAGGWGQRLRCAQLGAPLNTAALCPSTAVNPCELLTRAQLAPWRVGEPERGGLYLPVGNSIVPRRLWVSVGRSCFRLQRSQRPGQPGVDLADACYSLGSWEDLGSHQCLPLQVLGPRGHLALTVPPLGLLRETSWPKDHYRYTPQAPVGSSLPPKLFPGPRDWKAPWSHLG